VSGFGLNDFRQEEQSPVSFYENLLLSGEEALFSGEYQRAIKELEIAAFGLFHKKDSAAKAYTLISLSYYHLENREKAEKFLKDAALFVSEDELRAIELNIDNADRDVLESLIQDFDVFGDAKELPVLEEDPLPLEEPQKVNPPIPEKTEQAKIEQDKTEQAKIEQEKKVMPLSVDERITQLVEEREKQQQEQVKEKAGIPVKKEMAKKPAEKNQEERSQIKEMEEIFILDEPVQKSILSEIRIQKGANSIEIGILFQPYTQHKVFEIIDAPPKRIVIDISNITGIKAGQSIDINDVGITSIRTGMFKVNVARVVFDAVGDLPTYRIEKTEGGLRVVIEKSPL